MGVWIQGQGAKSTTRSRPSVGWMDVCTVEVNHDVFGLSCCHPVKSHCPHFQLKEDNVVSVCQSICSSRILEKSREALDMIHLLHSPIIYDVHRELVVKSKMCFFH